MVAMRSVQSHLIDLLDRSLCSFLCNERSSHMCIWTLCIHACIVGYSEQDVDILVDAVAMCCLELLRSNGQRSQFDS